MKKLDKMARDCAQARVDESNPISPHTTFSDVVYGFKEGAKAAEGQGEARIKELEEALRFYAAEWGSAVNDELIRQGGFFPYDANDYDQVKDGGKIARQALSGAGKGEVE